MKNMFEGPVQMPNTFCAPVRMNTIKEEIDGLCDVFAAVLESMVVRDLIDSHSHNFPTTYRRACENWVEILCQ